MNVPRSWRTTSASKTADASSAHCRSSSTSSNPFGLAAWASRRRTSANIANRWALPESAPSASAGHSASAKTRDHRPGPDGSSPAARTAGSSSASCHRPYGGRLPASAARGPRHRHAPRRGRRGGLLRQPGLPDPRLTRAQHQATATRQGVIQQQHDPGQLAVTSHHRPGGTTPHTSHQATVKPAAVGALVVVTGGAGGALFTAAPFLRRLSAAAPGAARAARRGAAAAIPRSPWTPSPSSGLSGALAGLAARRPGHRRGDRSNDH